MENERLVTIQDLIDFKAELLREIRAIVPGNKAKKKWIKSSKVREMLELSPGKLQSMRNNDEIPFTRIGRVIYYLEEAVHEMMEAKSNTNGNN
ncbi:MULTISPECIES: helix-turn-helix domain-containing protein [Sphingobacterium]|uniref:helix-turn-helix domain-containing protein n=1 Tax=Sphingobacterium TaxID=28453 RepID=UPI0028A5832E|nr:helix-turn-helix domain-containing protein [Sphingobacterium multivorum]